jgi:hypothetical protein
VQCAEVCPRPAALPLPGRRGWRRDAPWAVHHADSPPPAPPRGRYHRILFERLCTARKCVAAKCAAAAAATARSAPVPLAEVGGTVTPEHVIVSGLER